MPVPSKERVIALLSDLVEARGFDLEDVTVVAAGKHSAVKIMVDRDEGIDLDSLPALSRDISMSSTLYRISVRRRTRSKSPPLGSTGR